MSVDIVQATDDRERSMRIHLVKADVLGPENKKGAPAEASKAIDPFKALGQQVRQPPTDLLRLAKMPTLSAVLGPCIEAMVQNIDGFGHLIVPRMDPTDEKTPQDVIAAMKKEAVAVRNWLASCARGDAQRFSFTELRKRTRADLETTGNAIWEVLRARTGRLIAFRHLPSHQFRIVDGDEQAVEVDLPFLEEQPDGTFKRSTYRDTVVFKKYVQGSIQSGNPTQRYFKAYGDPRVMDNKTGKYVTGEEAAKLPESQRASEVYHFTLYASWTPYGVTRWYGNAISVLGSRAGEETNYRTLKNHAIPSMVITVSGGRITGASIDRVKEFLDSQISGNGDFSQFLLLEGESGGTDTDETSRVKIDIKALQDTQIRDVLFKDYMKVTNAQVRQSFRLPGIFVGEAEGVTKSSAEELRKLTDEQVFAPPRDEFDWTMTNVFFADLGFVYHTYESQTPNTTDNIELIGMMSSSERSGAMTPRRADRILRKVFKEASQVPLGTTYNLDEPFSMTMAAAVQNQAQPTEVGQQVAPVQPKVNPTLSVEKSVSDDVDYMLSVGDQLADVVRQHLAERRK